MASKHSKKQIERLKKAHGKRAGAVRAGSQVASSTRWTKRNASTDRIVGSEAKRQMQAISQPRPKLPLLSGGKDPTLGERFEEELLRL